MTLDRAELAGTGAALLLHAALIAALSLSLAKVPHPPEPPAMEVELVDEVAHEAAAPSPAPPAAQAPSIDQAPVIEPVPPPPKVEPAVEPAPAPVVEPIPPPPIPRVEPARVSKPTLEPFLQRAPLGSAQRAEQQQVPKVKVALTAVTVLKPSAKPATKPVTLEATKIGGVDRLRAPQPTLDRSAPASVFIGSVATRQSKLDDDLLKSIGESRPSELQRRVSRLGDDLLKGIADAPAAGPAAAAPTFNASVLAGIAQAIRRQVQPCADRQVDPGNGANRIAVRMRLRLNRTGRLLSDPQIVGTSGVDDENRTVEERVKDIAIAAFVGCAPLSGLPPELYKANDGRGWGDFVMNYRLP